MDERYMKEEEAMSSSGTWVDRMQIVPLSDADDTKTPAKRQGDHDRHSLEFNIASLNVLAESYLTPRSHPGLPETYANVAFNPIKRRKLLLDTLQRFCKPTNRNNKSTTWDILALQELDMLQPGDPILPAFESWGYQIVRTSNDLRRDCCAIAFDASKFSLLEFDVVNFDDLATLQNINGSDVRGNALNEGYNKIRPKTPNSPSELTGMVRSFLRRNCAVVAHLKCIETKQSLIVTSVHLYWHPGYEYVKLCQSKYLLDRVVAFAQTENKNTHDAMANADRRIPTIICGDMNSKPGSLVHKLFLEPHVDARKVAPWRYVWDSENEEIYTEEEDENDREDGQDPIITAKSANGYVMNGLPADFTTYCGVIDSNKDANDDKGNEMESEVKASIPRKDEKILPEAGKEITSNDDLQATLAARRLNGHSTPQDYQHSTPPLPVKYHLDYTLNRFTRWLRILGIDATLETLEEENERTSGGRIALFDHCKSHHRTLLTTSYKLLLRKDCPPGAYLLDPKSTADLELALPRLLRTHGIELSPCTFLTRCVVCNGNINPVLTYDERKAVFLEHGAPGLVDSKDDMEVFRCDGCQQGYWWDDRPGSSASRVFIQATKLLRLCLRGGVAVKDQTLTDTRKVVMGAFDFVDIEKERQRDDGITNTKDAELSVIEWLREEKLSNPFNLRSIYAAAPGDIRESLPFTNVTRDFVGCLDYVFFEQLEFEKIGQLNVPSSFREMNHSGAPRGHLIPSDIWPSDHIAVGARLRLKQQHIVTANGNSRNDIAPKVTASNGQAGSSELPIHSPKCACGCVPQILSLFEMAELRKKAREKKAVEAQPV